MKYNKINGYVYDADFYNFYQIVAPGKLKFISGSYSSDSSEKLQRLEERLKNKTFKNDMFSYDYSCGKALSFLLSTYYV